MLGHHNYSKVHVSYWPRSHRVSTTVRCFTNKHVLLELHWGISRRIRLVLHEVGPNHSNIRYDWMISETIEYLNSHMERIGC